MTSSTVGESSLGQTGRCMKVNSGMISGMDQAHTSIQVVKWESLCGYRAKLITDFIANKKRNIDAGTLIKKLNNDHSNIIFKLLIKIFSDHSRSFLMQTFEHGSETKKKYLF